MLTVMARKDHEEFEEPTQEDLQRVAGILGKIGGPNVSWGAQQSLDVLLVELRIRAERLASERLTKATYFLGAATVVLALATVALVVVTIRA
jgi:hypothetical protein